MAAVIELQVIARLGELRDGVSRRVTSEARPRVVRLVVTRGARRVVGQVERWRIV